MVRRYKKKLDKEPIPWKFVSEVAEAAGGPKVPPPVIELPELKKKIKKEDYINFVETCIALVTNAIASRKNPYAASTLSEAGYGGTCFDFILDEGVIGDRAVTDSAVASKIYETNELYTTPLCTADGKPAQCIGKMFDYIDKYKVTYPEREKSIKSLRNTFINKMSSLPVDLATPLCRGPAAEQAGVGRVACMERLFEQPSEAKVIIENKLGHGQSMIPSLKAQCITLDGHRTTCFDKILDDLIVIGSDDKNTKYRHDDHKYYIEMMSHMAYYRDLSGMRDAMAERNFVDTTARESKTTGYDKLIRLYADVGDWRGFVSPILHRMAERSAIDYSFIGENPAGCFHPYTRSPTTCLDAAIAIMHERRPQGPLSKKHPKSSNTRYKSLYEYVAKGAVAASPVELRDDCTQIPSGRKKWEDVRVPCFNHYFDSDFPEIQMSVYESRRNIDYKSKMCRMKKPGTEEYAEITCLEMIMRRLATKASDLMRGGHSSSASRLYSSLGTMLSGSNIDLVGGQDCHSEDFSQRTSCFDLLLGLDPTGVSTQSAIRADTMDVGKGACTLTKNDDIYNIAQRTIGQSLPKGVTDAYKKLPETSVQVNCLDKIVTMSMKEFAAASRGEHMLFNNYAATLISSSKTKWDSPCRNLIYRNGELVNDPIPCDQKYFGAIFPVSRSSSSRGSEGVRAIENLLRTKNMSTACISYDFGKEGEVIEKKEVPCLAYLLEKFTPEGILAISRRTDGTWARSISGIEDLRCSLIANKHFFDIFESMKAYRDKYGDFKDLMCAGTMCRGYDDATGQEWRSKSKIGFLTFCKCGDVATPEGAETPEFATCFEEACYNTVAKMSNFPEHKQIYQNVEERGDKAIAPVVRFSQESKPYGDAGVLREEIGGVYEISTSLSPYDLHVRRYIGEFLMVLSKVDAIARQNTVDMTVRGIRLDKVTDKFGSADKALGMSPDDRGTVDDGEIKVKAKPVISLYTMVGGKKVPISADVVQEGMGVQRLVSHYGREFYAMREGTGYTGDSTLRALTEVAKAYIVSDDKNIYVNVDYVDSKNRKIVDYQFHEVMPGKDEVALSKAQMRELKDKKVITMPDGKVVSVKYDLRPRELSSSYRLSKLASLSFIPDDVQREIVSASKIAAGITDKPLKLVISADPRDLFRASTCQAWGSCTKLEDGGGCNNESLTSYANAGSYVAFITDNVNSPMWKTRIFIHRTVFPKILAAQDGRHGTEFAYGFPEYRKILLDAVHTIMHQNGYNRQGDPNYRGGDIEYLWTDYHEDPAKYVWNAPEVKEKLMTQFTRAVSGIDDIRIAIVRGEDEARTAAVQRLEKYAGVKINFDELIDTYIAENAEKMSQYTPGAGLKVAREMVFQELYKNFKETIDKAIAKAIPNFENPEVLRQWKSFVRSNVSMLQSENVIPFTEGNAYTDIRGEPGRHEFRYVKDTEIEEIKRYRGEFVKKISDYKRPYATRKLKFSR